MVRGEPGRSMPASERVTTKVERSTDEAATLAQIFACTGWQQHTVRGTLAGAFKKKLGLTIDSTKEAGGERIYRIAG